MVILVRVGSILIKFFVFDDHLNKIKIKIKILMNVLQIMEDVILKQHAQILKELFIVHVKQVIQEMV